MSSTEQRRLLAVTMGDPAGVGPELLVKVALEAAKKPGGLTGDVLVAVGDRGVLSRAATITAPELVIKPVKPGELKALRDNPPGYLPVIDLANVSASGFTYGALRSEYGRAAYESLVAAIDLAMAGAVDAIVTNPLNKEALHLAGFTYGGHTEILAERTGVSDYCMMLAHDAVRVAHVSTHVSLKEACERVNEQRVLRVIELLHDALLRFGVADVRIAVAGLNPHAGENGLFGTEEIDSIIPAVREARRRGMDVSGPYPPDTLFSQLAGGVFSGAVVMYHDQGHIPVKLLGFEHTGSGFGDVKGVNITLGLPIIRTSVDHGTAFDIAGTGKASTSSLSMAIEYAGRLVGEGRG